MRTEKLPDLPPANDNRDARLWAMLLHFSLLTGSLVPLGGLIVPVVIWQLKRADVPGLDAHGKIAVNWIISEIIYAVVFLVLAFVWIGVPLLIGLKLVSVAFPIIGGIKANEGEVWDYPLSFQFF